MCAKKVLVTVLAAWLVCGALSAQTAPRSYYISPIGNDENNGRTPDTAFKTLSKAFQQAGSGVIKTITVLGHHDNWGKISGTGTTEILLTGGSLTSLSISANIKLANITIQSVSTSGTVTVSTGCAFGEMKSAGTLLVEDNAHIGELEIWWERSVVTITDNAVINKLVIEEGKVTMQGNSKVTGEGMKNTRTYSGIANRGELLLKERASVTKCSGGGIVSSGMVVLQDDASVTDNKGSGIWGGNITLKGRAVISGNTAEKGGGIYFQGDSGPYSGERTIIRYSLVIQENARITGNRAKEGGGIYITKGSIEEVTTWGAGGPTSIKYVNHPGVLMQGGSITDNKADYGAGIFLEGPNEEVERFIKRGEFDGSFGLTGNTLYGISLLMTGGTITGNAAEFLGGGVYQKAKGALGQEKGIITGNTAGDGEGNDIFTNPSF